MANPNRKEAEERAKEQRKNNRKNNNGRTSKAPENPEIVETELETEQPYPAEVRTGQEQNGENARKLRNKDNNPKARRSNRSDNYNHATNSNGLLSPASVGVNYKVFDAEALAATDRQKASGKVQGMTIQEATKERVAIAKEMNALDVQFDKSKLVERGYQVQEQDWKTVRAGVKAKIAEVQASTEVVNHSIALVDYDIAEWKLVEKEAQLDQQIIAAEGTEALTEPIRENWQLKYVKQVVTNDGLKLQIQQSRAENLLTQNQTEKKILDLEVYDVLPA